MRRAGPATARAAGAAAPRRAARVRRAPMTVAEVRPRRVGPARRRWALARDRRGGA